jgi:hypothetical protein
VSRWLHSYEESSDEELVFRPESYRFPPARGRVEIELAGDGSFTERAPGPDDRPVASDTLAGWTVAEVSAGRLTLRRGPRPRAAP